VKRWEKMVMPVAALSLLASAAMAAVPGYTLKVTLNATGELEGGTGFQMGRVNNKGQYSGVVNIGERVFAWDGTKGIRVSDDTFKTPDGAAFSTGNVWTSLGMNDAGVVAWVADMDGSVAGVKYIVTFDINTKQYAIIERPGDPLPGGGTAADGGNHGATDRMLADINSAGQVVWNRVIAGPEGDPRSGIFMWDPVTKEKTAVARPGQDVVGGTKLDNGWNPAINDAGQVVFNGRTAAPGEDPGGVFMAEKGTITPIAVPGQKVGDLTIASARWGDIANNGDIALVADTGDAQTDAAEVTDNTAVLVYRAATKQLEVIAKPGDTLPGGSTFAGVEASRRVVIATSNAVAFAGVRADGQGGIYIHRNGQLEALITDGGDVPGLGKVDGVVKGIGGVSGYHMDMSENGYVAFPAVVDGVEGFVVATPPAPTAGG
jgi:hypothetical protein